METDFLPSGRRVADDNSTASSGFMRKYDMGSVFNSSHRGLDDKSSTSSQDMMRKYGRGNEFGHRAGDDNSGMEAEDILNNYLSMKGRFNSRRFDSNRAVVVSENEI